MLSDYRANLLLAEEEGFEPSHLKKSKMEKPLVKPLNRYNL